MAKQSKDAQILDLTNQVALLQSDNLALVAKLKSADSNKDTWYRQHNEKQAELDRIHDLLDVLPNPVARKTGTDEDESYSRRDRTVMERLVAYLVRRTTAT